MAFSIVLHYFNTWECLKSKWNRIVAMKCSECQSSKNQTKAGFNPSGSQKYQCGECDRIYTPHPKPNGYPAETRLLAVRMYVEGSSYRSIARILKVNPQSVVNWVSAYTAKLPNAPLPEKVKKAELDELYTFVGKKKTKSTF
jgi:insertion element IS1 protein InsB